VSKKQVKGTTAFSKKQILKSKEFSHIEKDVLNAILKDGKQYTLEQVEKILEDFKKRKVK
jgi:hypothetical protein